MPAEGPPERPQSEADLDFERKPMVRWFSPMELIRTGTEAVLSSLFGAYADWREVQALRAEQERPRGGETNENDIFRTLESNRTTGRLEWYDLSDSESLWFDYVADLGDGFDSTYTVARLLGQETLSVGDHETERGRFLVMGGDQVYPAASRAAYHNRLVGPYRAALPYVPGAPPPHLFAIPGNHDWYDGLTSFLRRFSQNRWIGGWKAQQRRSYFAIKLPHDWWLWGIDVQLDSDVDLPQLNYFRAIAETPSVMPPGSKVVLCTPEPTWVYAETKGADAYHNLGYFQDKVLTPNNHELAVGLAGDLHTYARYAEADTNRQRFVAGGGGAYLYPTHDLPETLDVKTPDGDRTHLHLQRGRAGGSEESVFPSRRASRRLSWGALGLPLKNPGFGGVIAVLYLLFAWLLESSTLLPVLSPDDRPPSEIAQLPSLLESMAARSSFLDVVGVFFDVLKHTPGATALLLVLLGGLIAFADVGSTLGKIAVGTLHTAGHLLLAIALMWAFASLNFEILAPWTASRLTAGTFWHMGLFTVEMLLVGGILGGVVVGLYLVVTNRFLGAHANEVFSCQHIPDYKNVLRLHVTEDGGLTIYPLGVTTVETEWTLRPDEGPEAPWFEGQTPVADRVELIESPVSV